MIDEERISKLEARIFVHGLALRYMFAKFQPNVQDRATLREDLCGAIDRFIERAGSMDSAVSQWMLVEAEALFDLPKPRAG